MSVETKCRPSHLTVMSAIGPYSRPDALRRIDGRTREGRLLRAIQRDLVEHVGGSPSTAQRLLIEQAASLRLHLAMMDRRTAEGRELTERDGRQYLAWSNSLSKLLRHLGLKGTAARPKTLQQHMAERGTAA